MPAGKADAGPSEQRGSKVQVLVQLRARHAVGCRLCPAVHRPMQKLLYPQCGNKPVQRLLHPQCGGRQGKPVLWSGRLRTALQLLTPSCRQT